MKDMAGVERLIKRWEISGTDAMDVRDWAESALYWNAMILLDPMDLMTILMGAKGQKEFDLRLRELIDRKLDLKP